MKEDLILEAINGLSRRIDKLDDKIDTFRIELKAQIDEQGARIDEVEKNLNARIDEVEKNLNARIDEVEKNLNARIDEVEKNLNARIDEVEKNLNARIDEVEKNLSSRMDRVENEMNSNFKGVGMALNTAMLSLDKKIENFKTENELEHQVFRDNLKIAN